MFPCGYWSPTYKDLYEVWNEVKRVLEPVTKRKDEQVKQIELITGGKVDFWSLEEPDSGRGRKYKVAVVDEAEKAKKLKEALNGTIIATLADYMGELWVVSSPKFGKTYFKELYNEADSSDFCRNQQVKKAILSSVSLLEMNDFDSILQLVGKAVRAGEDKTVGLDYNLDVEARYREDDRKCIPFPWPTFNELTQGGYGKGDLVLLFGNPGGGKSWAVTAMGAYAADLS